MQITQDFFEVVVEDLVRRVNEKHAHVKTVTAGGQPVQFQIGLSTMSDALLAVLESHKVTVVDEITEAGVVLPEALSPATLRQGEYEAARREGWNECRAEVVRLNSTATN